jgi:hypothetical protein
MYLEIDKLRKEVEKFITLNNNDPSVIKINSNYIEKLKEFHEDLTVQNKDDISKPYTFMGILIKEENLPDGVIQLEN